MERKIKVTSEFDNKFIQMATESSDIFNCLTVLSDKITAIESPSDLVNNSYMLTYCGEE